MWQTIKDWFWWTFIIKKNEFHQKLNMNYDSIDKGKTTIEKENNRIYRDRDRAHNLDAKWG